ncbi:MAG: hypothetical protein JJU05_05175 [Verrucomicrobia bacterium]|nr:hypothetical protein [Verrucomicrobiota bacterium]MCH8525804.1 hypothetical protein [Kiritimatiellia bacterium]
MDLLADTHIHLYPQHDIATLIDGAVNRLRAAAGEPAASCALFLTEGKGFQVFQNLKTGAIRLPETHTVDPSPESGALYIHHGGNRTLLVAGRQIVAAERVEILALALETEPEDGQRAADIIAAVDAAGAVPVLAWSPGKWMFSRAEVVDRLTRHAGDVLHLGDSSLRCTGWPLPKPMANARLPVLAGSDPLPFSGDESTAGSYGVRITLQFDEKTPVTSIRRALRDNTTPIVRIGQRNSPLQMARRMVQHRRHKSS